MQKIYELMIVKCELSSLTKFFIILGKAPLSKIKSVDFFDSSAKVSWQVDPPKECPLKFIDFMQITLISGRPI